MSAILDMLNMSWGEFIMFFIFAVIVGSIFMCVMAFVGGGIRHKRGE